MVKSNELSLDSFRTMISNSSNSMLLCGNGLSINFEPQLSLSALGTRLYDTHNKILLFGDYSVVKGSAYAPIFKPNFQSTCRYLKKSINNAHDFSLLFEDGIAFASTLLNGKITDWLSENNFVNKLEIGIGPLDLIKQLIKQAQANGVFGVNYEYWSLLIYFVLAVQSAPKDIYQLDINNRFVESVSQGSQHTLGLSQKLGVSYYSKTLENGMYTYLRLLLSSNVLFAENGIDVTALSKWNDYDHGKLKEFFSLFTYLTTTNYDAIIEQISGRYVDHLHGKFMKEKHTALYQSLGVYHNIRRIDLTSILVGDYFTSKSFYAITANMASKNPINAQFASCNQILEDRLVNDKSNLIVVFGLNVDNDFHILRDIQINLGKSNSKSANIVFCYYNAEDKESFISTYNRCITYSSELNEYVRKNISIHTLSSRTILENYFITAGD